MFVSKLENYAKGNIWGRLFLLVSVNNLTRDLFSQSLMCAFGMFKFIRHLQNQRLFSPCIVTSVIRVYLWNIIYLLYDTIYDFPGGSDGKVSAYNGGDPGLIPGLGRSSGEGNGNSVQYSCLENPTDGVAWWSTVHGVAKGWARLSDFTFFTSEFICEASYIYSGYFSE